MTVMRQLMEYFANQLQKKEEKNEKETAKVKNESAINIDNSFH